MKCFRAMVVMLALSFGAVAHADPAPPSDASIHQLMDLLQVDKLMDGMFARMKSAMEQAALQGVGHPLDAQEQKILTNHIDQMTDLMRTQMAWSQLQPSFTAIYRKNFTQQQINDLLAFYRSPTGQVVINKMPEVMQESMQIGFQRSQQAMPQMRLITQDMMQQFKDYEASKHPAAAAH